MYMYVCIYMYSSMARFRIQGSGVRHLIELHFSRANIYTHVYVCVYIYVRTCVHMYV